MLQRVWSAGARKGCRGSMVITIPFNFVTSNNIQEGDYLKIAEDHIEVVKNKKKG